MINFDKFIRLLSSCVLMQIMNGGGSLIFLWFYGCAKKPRRLNLYQKLGQNLFFSDCFNWSWSMTFIFKQTADFLRIGKFSGEVSPEKWKQMSKENLNSIFAEALPIFSFEFNRKKKSSKCLQIYSKITIIILHWKKIAID